MNIKFDFFGKIALVTGAATGLGRQTALQFAKAGATVIVADFNPELGKKTVEDCKALGAKSIFCEVNVGDENTVRAMAKKVIDEFGYIDILVSNAGIGPKDFGNPFTQISPNDIRNQYNVNTVGFANMIQAFYETFTSRKQGKVVCTSSIAAFLPTTLHPHYGASKVALLAFMKSMALELGPYNINVNAIAPGFVYTPIYHEATIFKGIFPGRFDDCETSEEVVLKMAKQSSMRRWQSEADMANAIMILCSDECENVTGQCLTVDSGRLLM